MIALRDRIQETVYAAADEAANAQSAVSAEAPSVWQTVTAPVRLSLIHI